MASTCYQSIADSYPYKSILNLDFQLPKPSAPSDAIALGCARFNLSPVNTPCLMHDRRFQGLPATGQSLSSDYTADPEEEAEISDSDDDDLPSIRKIIARSRSTIDLTLDDDDDDDNASDKNTIETTSNLPTYSPHVPPSSLQKSLAHIADDHTTSSAAATPARKIFPWKNVPPWSPLYHKLQLHSTTSLHNQTVDTPHAGSGSRGSTEPESPPNKIRVLAVEPSEFSPEIPGTPGTNRNSPLVRDSAHDPSSVEMDNLQSTDQTELIASINGSGETHLSIARSSEQTLALMTVSASSLSDAIDDSPAIVNVSKVLDKRSSSSGVEYKCDLEPLWLAAALAEGAQMGRVRIRSYENGLIRDRRLKTLRVGKRKFSEM